MVRELKLHVDNNIYKWIIWVLLFNLAMRLSSNNLIQVAAYNVCL
jgi:hypothetical protein